MTNFDARELDRLEALARAATPGPWSADFDTVGDQGGAVGLRPGEPSPRCGRSDWLATFWSSTRHRLGYDTRANAIFAAAYRDAGPALCAEVRRLRRVLALVGAERGGAVGVARRLERFEKFVKELDRAIPGAKETIGAGRPDISRAVLAAVRVALDQFLAEERPE